ncbi:olfactory receptor 14A16-like, partial [Tiliqua scincoides]|uniref:olfactory receptor 14A16-like n=1 Tax=Tiliqua scincoides TaxID=71010 RepID=UPI0034617DFC
FFILFTVSDMANQTSITGFLLLQFSDRRALQMLHFVSFLAIYLAALTGNILIISAVVQNQHLHSPMYFFLVNLSLVDICYISTTVPKSMANSLSNNSLISFSGCATQVFLVVALAGNEVGLLTVMAYDRYVAICNPLRYGLIMKWNYCFHMAAASWLSSVLFATAYTANTFRLHFCLSNVIKKFYCDIPQLLSISCSDTQTVTLQLFAVATISGSFCCGLIFVSYSYIFSAVFKIQSAQGRHKAFSTCTPHLTIFTLFVITGVLSYLRPRSWSSPPMDLVFAVFYSVLPPLLNPIIYCLRNREIQVALYEMSKKMGRFHIVTW